MSKQQHVNNYRTALDGPIGSTDTVIGLSDVTRVPTDVSADEPLLLTIVAAGVSLPTLAEVEIVEVTAVTPDSVGDNGTVTVNRGQDGTTAKSWSAGDTVGARATARSFDRALQTSTFDDQKTANASVNPDAWWLSNAPAAGYGATGIESVAIGNNAYTSGDRSFVQGQYVKATERYSFTLGKNINNDGDYSMAFGVGLTLDSFERFSLVAGKNHNITGGNYNAVFGHTNIVTSFCSLVTGRDNEVDGGYALQIGYGNYSGSWSTIQLGYSHYAGGSFNMLSTQIGSSSVAQTQYASFIGCSYRGATGPHDYYQSISWHGVVTTQDAAATYSGKGLQIGYNKPSGLGFRATVFAQSSNYEAMWAVDGLAAYTTGGLNVSTNVSQLHYTGSASGWTFDFIGRDPSVTGDIARLYGRAYGATGEDIEWSIALDAAHLQTGKGTT